MSEPKPKSYESWAGPFGLMVLVFLESWIFPIPPDPFYVPELLKRPHHIWSLAFGCTLVSVLGGLVGYALGHFFQETFGQWMVTYFFSQETFHSFQAMLRKWGGWLIVVKGLTPVPYKFITLVAGTVGVSLKAFLLASVISRGIRFYGLAWLVHRFGRHAIPLVKKYQPWVYTAYGVLGGAGLVWLMMAVWRSAS